MEEIAAANGLLELNRGIVSLGYELVDDEFLGEFQLDAAADCKRALRSCSDATHLRNQQAPAAAPPVMIPVSDSSSLQAVVASSVQQRSSRHNNDEYHHQMAAALPAAAARPPGFHLDGADYYCLQQQQQQPVLPSIDDMIIEDKSALQPPMEPCFLLPDSHVLMMDETAAAAAQQEQARAGFFAFPEEQKVFAVAAADMFQAVPPAGGAAPTGRVSVGPLPLCCHDVEEQEYSTTEEMLAAASFFDAMAADECWTSLMDEEQLLQQQQQQNPSCSTTTLAAAADLNQPATLLWILQQQQEQRQREDQLNIIIQQQQEQRQREEQLNKILQQQQEQRQREEQLNKILPAAAILAANAPPIAVAAEGTIIQAEANTGDSMQQQQDEKPRTSRLQDFQTAYESALRNNQVIDLDALEDDDDDQQSDSSSSDSEETLPVLPDLREHAASSSWGGLRNDPVPSSATCIKLSDKELVKTLRSKRSSSSCSPDDLNIAEVDVYADHPARLLNQQGAWMGYFFSKAKYCNFARPTRSRLTIEGCRWKQQGPSLPIRVDGDVVAYKTYLSFVSLKNTNADDCRPREGFLSTQKNHHGFFKRSRRCSRYTMEEIVLREDKELELAMLNSGRKPPPFHVLCRISQKMGQSEVGISIPSAIPIPTAVLHQRRCAAAAAARDEVTIAFSDRSSLTFQLSPIEEMLQSMAEAEDMPCCGGELCL